jgi:hypothetical protein
MTAGQRSSVPPSAAGLAAVFIGQLRDSIVVQLAGHIEPVIRLEFPQGCLDHRAQLAVDIARDIAKVDQPGLRAADSSPS